MEIKNELCAGIKKNSRTFSQAQQEHGQVFREALLEIPQSVALRVKDFRRGPIKIAINIGKEQRES